MVAVDSVERVLWWLFGSSAGAATRARVVRALQEEPRNAQQLAQDLVLDYTTVRHHLRVLQKNGLVVAEGDRYGRVYFVSDRLETRWDVFLRIVERMEQKRKGRTRHE